MPGHLHLEPDPSTPSRAMNKLPYIILTLTILTLLTGCDIVRHHKEPRCVTVEEKTKQADWALQCIEKGNPMSDEEGEDLVAQCEQSGRRVACPLKCVKSIRSFLDPPYEPHNPL